jgi:hypothetical protein
MSGWIKLHRRMVHSQHWLSEPFTRGQAWVDLLMLANFETGYLRIGGELIEIKRGQCGWSQLKLAERWKWSRGKVDRFLDELSSNPIDRKIELKTGNRNTIITICNYDRYQDEESDDSTTDETSDGHQIGQQTDIKQDTKKKNKEERRRNNNITLAKPDDLTAEVWTDFLTLRKAKKAPVTETALKGIRTEAAKAGIDFQNAIEIMVTRGWTGFKADWITAGGTTHANPKNRTNGKELRGHAALAELGKAADYAVEQEKSQGRVRSAAEIFNLDRERLLETPAEPAAQLAYSGDGSPMRQHDDQSASVFLGDAAG